MQRLYFGGSFPKLDKNDPEGSMKGDFRALVLGDVKRMLYSPQDGSMEVPLSDSVSYVGPYYYYDGMLNARLVVSKENEMIRKCSDAVFLLENSDSPGTITELVYAAMLGKKIHVFYVGLKTGTPMTAVNSDQWYPITFIQMINENVECVECYNRDDAINKILLFVESIR